MAGHCICVFQMCTLLVCGSAHANAILEPPVIAAEPVPELLDVVDAPRDFLSEKIVDFSKRMDRFFGDERYFQENNKSVIQLDFNQTIEQSGNRIFKFEGKAKLDLPAAQKRFQLVLEVNPEKKAAGEVNKNQPVNTTLPSTTTPDKYAASFRFEESEESNWHFSSETGIKVELPLDPFVRTRGRYSIPLGEWRLSFTESLFWFGTIGLGETTQIELERVLSKPVLFRATSTATCMETTQICDMRQDLALFHTVDDRNALLYQVSAIGSNKPVMQETAFVLLLKYRYRMHREWVFFEAIPQLNFPRTDGFKLNASLLLRLEVLFGATR